MRITVLAIGRNRDLALQTLVDSYLKRCPWPVAIEELVPRKGESEAERLARAVPEDAALLALDERGEVATSRELAERLRSWRDQGRDVAILVGGADGLAPALLSRAHWRLAMGRLTWPHMLVRLMLAEQLYRAGAILAGHPYHRE